MSFKLEFEIPGLPKMTNANGRGLHWSVAAKEAKNWKQWVANSCYYFGTHFEKDLPLKKAKLTLTRFSSVEPDGDGRVSGFKHVIDGLVECGVLENDKFSNIGMPDYRWEKAKPGKGKIRVVVESIPEPHQTNRMDDGSKIKADEPNGLLGVSRNAAKE